MAKVFSIWRFAVTTESVKYGTGSYQLRGGEVIRIASIHLIKKDSSIALSIVLGKRLITIGYITKNG